MIRKIVKCGGCKGTGYDPHDNTCRACGGIGKVDLPEIAVKCAKCNGEGFDVHGYFCSGCEGTGWGVPKKFF